MSPQVRGRGVGLGPRAPARARPGQSRMTTTAAQIVTPFTVIQVTVIQVTPIQVTVIQVTVIQVTGP